MKRRVQPAPAQHALCRDALVDADRPPGKPPRRRLDRPDDVVGLATLYPIVVDGPRAQPNGPPERQEPKRRGDGRERHRSFDQEPPSPSIELLKP
jgi:hypothetical protein